MGAPQRKAHHFRQQPPCPMARRRIKVTTAATQHSEAHQPQRIGVNELETGLGSQTPFLPVGHTHPPQLHPRPAPLGLACGLSLSLTFSGHTGPILTHLDWPTPWPSVILVPLSGCPIPGSLPGFHLNQMSLPQSNLPRAP